jgi:hypothetical protein
VGLFVILIDRIYITIHPGISTNGSPAQMTIDTGKIAVPFPHGGWQCRENNDISEKQSTLVLGGEHGESTDF